jgi:NADPH2:quinone reductase
MTVDSPAASRELRSLVKSTGELELSLVSNPVADPAHDEVTVRIEATPINPSDQGLLFGAADMSTARSSGTREAPVITAAIPAGRMKSMAGRLDRSMTVGNEGAGVVVRAGASPQAQALLGRTVALFGGGTYAQYRNVKAAQCLALPEGTQPADAASCFINPLTALGMVETMRREGHRALVHAPAASNLGQMLVRICAKDGIELVNIVRSRQQHQLLVDMGARHVCDLAAPSFADDLARAISATGATIAFDAIGGGTLASRLLFAMEAVAAASLREYSRYGSDVAKQVYIYGSLDTGPTILDRNFGLTWSIAGWLLWPFLKKIGPDAEGRLRARVVSELKTTFASRYTKVISLADALQLDEIAAYRQRATGGKVLINPNL